jgi:hypothetical protein
MTAYRTRWARMCSERWLRLHWRCHGGLPGLLEKLLPRHDCGLPWPQVYREQLPPARRRGFRKRRRGGRGLRRSENGRRRGNGRGCRRRRRRRRNPSSCGSGRGGGGRGGGRHGVFHGEAGGIRNSRGHGIRSKDLGFWGSGLGWCRWVGGVDEEVGSGIGEGGHENALGFGRGGGSRARRMEWTSRRGFLVAVGLVPRLAAAYASCLRNRNGRAWTCGSGGCLLLGLGPGNTKAFPYRADGRADPLAHGPRVRDWPTHKAR